jgi:uncharacterized repeat protein (TIGR01451 family)
MPRFEGYVWDEETQQDVYVDNNPAVCKTSAPANGLHMITAAYNGQDSLYHDATLTLEGGQTVISPSSADLKITLTDSKDPIKPGANLVYTLKVSNAGPDAAESVSVVDSLDPLTTYVSISKPKGWTCTHESGIVTCTPKASLASGSSATIKITVTVIKTAKVGKDLVNTAEVSSPAYDPHTENNSAMQKTTVAK